MREEARKRLDRLQIRDLLGWGSAVGLLAVFLIVVIGLRMSTDRALDVQGTVASAEWRLNEDTGQHYPHIEAKLDNGSSVRVGSLATTLPAIGERISIRQRPLFFEYLITYEWAGPEAPVATTPPVAPPAPTPVSLH